MIVFNGMDLIGLAIMAVLFYRFVRENLPVFGSLLFQRRSIKRNDRLAEAGGK